MQPHVLKAAESAPIATIGGSVASVTFWGLQVNEVCAIVSTLIAVAGLSLQIFLAFHRIRRVERKQGTTAKVVEAVAESHRVVADKVQAIENKEGN